MEFKAKTFDELSNRELYEILRVRCQIFVVEQKIMCQDMDGIDYKSLHCFLDDGESVVAYFRAYLEGEDCSTVRIGRVVTAQHGKGYGRELFEKAIPVIKEKMNCSFLCIHAQEYAAPFYEKCGGFKVTSEPFMEDGIPHVEMIAKL